MSAFDSARPRKPRATRLIPISAFAEDWRDRPTAPVAVGLRLLSETDCELAMAIAATSTVEFFKDSVEFFKDEAEDVYRSKMMGIAIARSICDPNDVLSGHPLFPAIEDQIGTFFSPDGVRLVYEMLDEMTVASSPIVPVASDDRLRLLQAHLQMGTVGTKLRGGDALMARRLLGRVLELLEAAAPEVSVHDGESLDEEPDPDDGIPSYAMTLST